MPSTLDPMAANGTNMRSSSPGTGSTHTVRPSACPKPAHNPGAGALMQAQLWYRDPLTTANQTSSMSDAIEFYVTP